MRIMVTGGSGLLGSRIAEMALDAGHEAISGYAHNLPEFGKAVLLDLTDMQGISVAIARSQPDVIVHSAALTDVDKCENDRDLAHRINVLGTKAVAEAAEASGAHLIYISTDYVFDGLKGNYSEADEVCPINYYGQTKLLGEKYCGCVARTCVIYGSSPASGKVNFALWIVNKLRAQETIKIVTDQYLTPTLNTNLAEMVLELADKRLKGIYHLAGATRISRYDFAVRLASEFGLDESLISPSKMADMKWAARRPDDSSLCTAKAARCLDHKPYEIGEAFRVLRSEME
ncbi:MAG TPA: dTDP-4-dehydrorhamnose reductase [Methanotrichaceae archaeon]|nr:dTDP-4-dehydrorhamnose reductase [Methanotrichaceae archaeon]